MALLPLGLGLMVLMTLAPSIATTQEGQADHPTALLLFWSMGALALALARLFALGKFGLPG